MPPFALNKSRTDPRVNRVSNNNGGVIERLLFSDNFNRADGGLGANYTTAMGLAAPQIVANQVLPGAGPAISAAYVNAIAWPNNQWAECTQHGTDGNDIGLLLRRNANDGYIVYKFGTNLLVNRYNGGGFTAIASVAIASLLNKTLWAGISGSAISIRVDGVLVLAANDASIANGEAGLFGFGNGILDNFRAGDFA